MEQAVSCASKYFVHPSHSSLLDSAVGRWASSHVANVRKASDQAAALKRAREHDHGDHGDAPRMPQQFASAWRFWGEHYGELTGETDMLAEIPTVGLA